MGLLTTHQKEDLLLPERSWLWVTETADKVRTTVFKVQLQSPGLCLTNDVKDTLNQAIFLHFIASLIQLTFITTCLTLF